MGHGNQTVRREDRIVPKNNEINMTIQDRQGAALAHNVKRLSHLDLAGAGQVTVDGGYAYVGHIPNRDQLGTTILDVADPHHPRVIAQIILDDPTSHSHKVRVAGDIMIVN